MSPIDRARETVEGLSVGDAFGQCFFGLESDDEARRLRDEMLPDPPWLWTDDTEMSCAIVDVLANVGRIDPDALAMRFARGYSYDRAYGPAMHRALARIRDGEDWRVVSRSLFGGEGSHGNGASMRSAPIGAFFAGDTAAVVENAALAAAVTHAHPEAIAGAVAVAVAAAVATEWRQRGATPSHDAFFAQVIPAVPAGAVRDRLVVARSMETVQSVQFPAAVLGTGVEMAAVDTVPFALWCCAQSLREFESAAWLAVRGGVDRDTIGAIVGGVVASHVGRSGIPAEWLRRREPLRW